MKATIDIPEGLYRQVKARAALEGTSLRSMVISALQARMGELSVSQPPEPAWRRLCGSVPSEVRKEIDEIVQEDLGHVDPGDWS